MPVVPKQVVLQPALDSTGNAMLAWLHAQQSYEAGKALAARRGPVSHQIPGHSSLSLSAQAAVHVHHKVKRLVAMMQVHEVCGVDVLLLWQLWKLVECCL